MPPQTIDQIKNKIKTGVRISKQTFEKFLPDNTDLLLDIVCHIDYNYNLNNFYHIFCLITELNIQFDKLSEYAAEGLYWLIKAEGFINVNSDVIIKYINSLRELYQSVQTTTGIWSVDEKCNWLDYVDFDDIESMCTNTQSLNYIITCVKTIITLEHGENSENIIRDYLSSINIVKIYKLDPKVLSREFEYIDWNVKYKGETIVDVCCSHIKELQKKFLSHGAKHYLNLTLQSSYSYFRSPNLSLSDDFLELKKIINFLITTGSHINEKNIKKMMEIWNTCLLISLNFSDFEEVFLFFSSTVYELCDTYWARMTCLKAIDKISAGISSSSIKEEGVEYSILPTSGWGNPRDSCIYLQNSRVHIFIPGFISEEQTQEDKIKSALRSPMFTKLMLNYNTLVAQLKPISLVRYIECGDEIMKYKDLIYKHIQIEDLTKFIHSYLVYKGDRTIIELNNRAYML